jgi:hypothetical protein
MSKSLQPIDLGKMILISLMYIMALVGSASSSSAAQIQLNRAWTPAAAPYNRAPPFYVWQNDRGLSEYLYSDGTTGLCVPATISNAMIYQYAFKDERSPHLKLPGISPDGTSIDGNTLIRHFARKCNYDDGVDFYDAGKCVLATYLESGYTKAKVRIIRKYIRNQEPPLEIESRAPTLNDLKKALDEGYEVIASLASMRFDPKNQQWEKVSGHAVNIYGMNGNEIIVSNPTRAYRMNFSDPLFDVGLALPSTPGTLEPALYAPIEITGRLLNFPNQTTFLAGLLLMKAQ